MARRGENIYKRKDGRYEGRYRSGFRSDGSPKYRSVYAKTYQAVKEKLLALKAEGQHFQPSGALTVKALFDEWLAAVQFRVKKSTYAVYRMKAEKHIIPTFGGLRYEQLMPDLVHQFIQQKIQAGLSPKYVADIVIVFKLMAKYVSRVHGFRNPLAEVALPKAEKRELQLLTEHQQKQLCRHLLLHPDPTSLGILLSLYMGLRIGEVCGLRWEDIDLCQSTLTVRRTVQRVMTEHGTRLMVHSPKSANSCRIIPIPQFLCDLLKQHQKCSGYFLTGSEQPLEPRTMQRRFHALLRKANLPSLRYHTLRHQFATNCIGAGFDVKTLSEILGHATVETTLKLYVHSSMERKCACMERIQLIA